MYADDLANPNFREEGAQQQFSQTEAAAERDGLRISYKKTELIVLRRGPRQQTANKWSLRGNRGEIHECNRDWAKYLGFYLQADGYEKQLTEFHPKQGTLY